MKANELLNKFLKLVTERNEVTPSQLSIVWLISRPGVFALCGARNPVQALENNKAGDIVLSEEDKASIIKFIDEYSKNNR